MAGSEQDEKAGRAVAPAAGDPVRRRGRCGFLIAAAAAMAVCAYGYGVLSHRYEIFPYHYIGWLLDGRAFDWLAPRGGYDVAIDRRAVPCREIGPQTLVLVTLGQSNSANSGDSRFRHVPGVYNFNLFDGQCFEAEDPLLGAGGDDGSVWMPLAGQILESGLAAHVVIAPIGLGGAQVADWAPGGRLSERIARLVEGMERAGLRPGAILWHQGESDRGTGREAYRAAFLAMARAIRDAGIAAPIYVARATRCGKVESPGINAEQAELGINHAELDLRQGPDTDKLTEPLWRNGCHFTRAGLVRHAGLWFAMLAADIPKLLGQSR